MKLYNTNVYTHTVYQLNNQAIELSSKQSKAKPMSVDVDKKKWKKIKYDRQQLKP